MKWINFTAHEKETRVKIVIFGVGLAGILIYTMGINDFTSLVGTMTLLWGILYLINEVRSWFKKV